jgi:hypothetical protein
MNACHNTANPTANVHLCQERFALSLLLYFAIVCHAESKDGFDSRARCQPQFHLMLPMVLRISDFQKFQSENKNENSGPIFFEAALSKSSGFTAVLS